MGWTTPRTWVALEVPSAATYNTHIKDNFAHICDTSGNLAIGTTGPHGLGAAVAAQSQFKQAGTYTATGAGVFVAGYWYNAALVANTGSTTFHAALAIQPSSITTQGATQTIADVATMLLQEPNISVGAGDTITTAATLWISGAPTEGTTNWAVIVDSGDVCISTGDLFCGSQIVVGRTTSVNYYQNEFTGSFVSGGGATLAAGVATTAAITSADGDETALIGTFLGNTLTTHGTVQSISTACQLYVQDPGITIGTATVSKACNIYVDTAPTEGVLNYAILVDAGNCRFDDRVMIGGNQLAFSQVAVGGSYTSDGSSTVAAGLYLTPALTAANGDTTWHAAMSIQPTSLTTQDNNETITHVTSLLVQEPAIVKSGGDTITTASTVWIINAPTEGTSNFALIVDAGTSRFDGDIYMAATQKFYPDGGTDTYYHEPADNQVAWVNGGTEFMRLTATGELMLSETSNANQTIGITINQGANDDNVIDFKSSDISTGVTTVAEDDTWGLIKKGNGASGGIYVIGLTEASVGVFIEAAVTTSVATKDNTASGAIVLRSGGIGGGGIGGATGVDANLVVIQDSSGGTSTRFIFDEDGDAHADVQWTTFDTHDDVALLGALDATMSKRDAITHAFGQTISENKVALMDAGVVNFYDDGPRAMLNTTRLAMLHTGAIRQLGARVETLEARLLALEA